MKTSTSIRAAIAALAAILFIPTQAMADQSTGCRDRVYISTRWATCTATLRVLPYHKLTYGGNALLTASFAGEPLGLGNSGSFKLTRDNVFRDLPIASGNFTGPFNRTKNSSAFFSKYKLTITATPISVVYSSPRSAVIGKMIASMDQNVPKFSQVCTITDCVLN